MTQRQCRIWWPEHLSFHTPINHISLFGWCISSTSDSVDFVVATGVSEQLVRQLDLKDFLYHVNKRVPQSLSTRSTFCLLGCCNSRQVSARISNILSSESLHNGRRHGEKLLSPRCRDLTSCDASDDLSETYNKFSSKIKYWLLLDHSGYGTFDLKWVPKFRHLRSNGQVLPVNYAHMIVYRLPSFYMHHFSLSNWTSFNRVIVPTKKPQWLTDLYKGQSSYDLDVAISTINCADAAKQLFEKCLGLNSSLRTHSAMSRLTNVSWHLLAAILASLSSILYMALSLGHRFIIQRLNSSIFIILNNLFSETSKNLQIRSSQFLYWSFFLQGSGSRSQPNVEYAHRAALKRHNLWSTIAVDLLLGNIFGLLLLIYSRVVCLWAFQISSIVTDNILRSGCVWLMGIPAGFKLNTELAALLGLLSLNIIQIWSTLWFYMGSLFHYSVSAVALSGMLLGLTIPAALCIDFLKFATLHVTVLHVLITFIYSQQIWALTSLWRLFRGQKWNPLRQRLDTFDYSVDQHVVGSLLFTPILLLLPTISVFYIFFTIISSYISLLCTTLEVLISVLHATPYAEVFLWVFARSRFPSGLWLELKNSSCQNEGILAAQRVLFLRSNYATLGQILGPCCANIFRGISLTGYSIRRVLKGQRIPSTLGLNLPVAMQWRKVNVGGYWNLCRFAVLTCASERLPSVPF